MPQDPTLSAGRGVESHTLPGGDADEAPALEAGGKFEILDVIGVGGSGVVYKVRHRQLDHVRAVKVLATNAGDEAVVRLRREAAIATELTHPNIVRVYDLETLEDGSLAIVMEYFEGEDLSDHVTRHGPMSSEKAFEAFRPVADALDRMHDAGVLHRDIKPANLFVCRDGTLKILDFSVSRLQAADSDLTRVGQLIGTPQYLAPEIYEGEPANAASDIYSLGTSLFFALTGHPPFHGSSRTELTLMILDTDRPRVETLCPAVPAAASRSVERALARQPEERWPTASAMVEAMVEPSTAEPSFPPPRRRGASVRVVLGSALVLSILAVVTWRVVPGLLAGPERGVVDAAVEPDDGFLTVRSSPDPTPGGTLRLGLPVDITSLDPTVTKFETFWGLHFLLYDSLVDVDWSGELLPSLARRWEIHDDATRFVFHLRDDAILHDDPCLPEAHHPLDAEDVRRSLERVFAWIARDEDSTWGYLPPVQGIDDYVMGRAEHPEGLRVLDPLTLEVTFELPAPSFLHCLRRPLWSVVAAEAIDTYGPEDIGHQAVGSGPYRLESANNNAAVLVRHPAAWHRDMDDRPLPYLDRVEVISFAGDLALSTAMKQERIDLVFRRGTRTLESAFTIEAHRALPRAGWEAFQAAAYLDEAHRHLSLLLFDKTSAHPYVHDSRIRQAVARAIRRTELSPDPFVPSDGPLVDGMLGYVPHALHDGDVEEAARLLADAGFPGGEGLPALSLCARTNRRDNVDTVASHLSEVSIDVQVTYLEYDTWAGYLRDGGCDLMLASYDDLVVNDDASDILRGLASRAMLVQRQPQLAGVIRQIGETTDRVRRAELSRELSQALVDDAMIIFLAYRSPERPIFRTVAHQRVQGLVDPVTGWMNPRRHHMHLLWLDEGGEGPRD